MPRRTRGLRRRNSSSHSVPLLRTPALKLPKAPTCSIRATLAPVLRKLLTPSEGAQLAPSEIEALAKSKLNIMLHEPLPPRALTVPPVPTAATVVATDDSAAATSPEHI
mmetsp:Transcript_84796/g.169402  ORF Transcript_84796/g.169402 Transcript_84796/m.169402 type:complete len:109 (+) Transcript_84796:1387-1713(+)